MKYGLEKCPRCGDIYRGNLAALSRVDNKTPICSGCGTAEAIFNWAYPGVTLPPVDRPVREGQISGT